MALTLPTGITSTPIREYGEGFTVRTAFTVYRFMTPEGADRFAAVASKPGAKRTPASAVHQRFYRLGPPPTCIMKARLRGSLKVESTPPPDRHRPSPALRIVQPDDSKAAEELAA